MAGGPKTRAPHGEMKARMSRAFMRASEYFYPLGFHLMSTSFGHISISSLGHEFSRLMGLRSIELSEISKAFGPGRIQAAVTY